MTIRIATAAVATTMFCACSQGQKERATLNNEMDSVSYAIGVDLANNFKRSKLDSANLEAVSMGMQDGMDSATLMEPAVAQQVIQKYFQRMQEAQRAEEAKKFEGNRAAGEAFLAANSKKPGITTTPTGLQYEVIKMGTGPKPTADAKVRVHYTGTLIDGTKFQSSHDSGQPVDYPVSGFVPGWVEALQMMPVGSTWKIYIPSDLGYGAQGSGAMIPPNSALIFELELLEILK